MMNLTRVGAAASIVSISEVKLQCRISSDDEDVLLALQIDAATEAVTEGVGLVLGSERWQLKSRPTAGAIYLPKAPAQALVSMTYLDADLSPQVADIADFEIASNSIGICVRPIAGKSWPKLGARDDAVTVVFDVGMATPAPALKMAVLLLVAHRYANREGVSDGAAPFGMPEAVQQLINLHRVGWVAA